MNEIQLDQGVWKPILDEIQLDQGEAYILHKI